MIAIGRSKILFDTIKYLSTKSYKFYAIVSDTGYEEYEVNIDNFRELANKIGCQFYKTKKLDSPEILDLIKSNNIKQAICVNWKYTIPEHFIKLFPLSILNFHMGNLPDYKGNATINWAIINGEKFIYANVHKINLCIDAGDIINRKKILISENTYVGDILNQINSIAPFLFRDAIEKLDKNPKYYILKGSEKGLRCYPRLPEDSQIVWNEFAENIHRLIRASSRPYKGAYTFLKNDKVIIWKASVKKPSNPFFAVPGHIVEIERKSGAIIVACNKSLLKVEEIEYKGELLKPAEVIKSIRLRFNSIPFA